MTEDEFWKLCNLIIPYYPEKQKTKKRKHKCKKDNTPNKNITKSIRLSAALQYFSGGCPLDIMALHGIRLNNMCNSVWGIINVINSCPKLSIVFPKCHEEQ